MSAVIAPSEDLFIHHPYDQYTPENHEAWCNLYSRMLPKWELYANPHFLKGIQALSLNPDRIPRLNDVNHFLQPLTGFRARAVSGYVPAFQFFDCLRQREFPTTVTIRRADQLDYLPEPDIFHDIAGHVPMHTDPHFAETLVRFGECARTAAQLNVPPQELTSIIRALARFFWFTIEFGLMRATPGERALKVYGSGLLSSFGEIQHAIESNAVQRYPIQLEWVINQSFEIDHYQPLLFIVDSFEHLYDLVGDLEAWMKQGRLAHVAPGEPAVREEDLLSFRSL
jgi:phenylalanine-4-hydroxylase